ncbi:MAG: 3-dehydroquinate synthase [Candidatus Rokubacteria bacterium]|nr:3-dehydroquinate synthase [Candidatus Rokubacteria bacterium]
MSPYLQKVVVSYDYPVYFTADVFSPQNSALVTAISRKEPLRRHRLLVILEGAVARAWPRLATDIDEYVAHHRDRLQLVADPLEIEGGEATKNDPTVLATLQAVLHARAMDRQSMVVIVGGGALLDAAGYAAATVHRGLRTVRVPTTVLAQNDSGVGVKSGVNAFAKKNFFGAFAPPFAVLNDRRFLETLGARDKIAGMAEAVKVALIRDGGFFAWLEEQAEVLATCEPDTVAELIRRCAELHLEHIATSGDPFEFGSARPLDFGHWAAHRLESLTDNRLRHGEAVAIGMALDTVYSVRAGFLAESALARVLGLLERLGLRRWDEALDRRGPNGRPLVLDGLTEFQEHLGGELTVTLLKEIGRGFEVHEMREDLVLQAIDWLRRRHGSE